MSDGGPDEAPAELTEFIPVPARRPVRDVWVAVGLTVGAALAVWAAFAGVGTVTLDAPALADSLEVRSGGLTSAAVLITNAGSTWTMGVLAVIVGAWCWLRGRRVDAAFTVLAMAGGALVMRMLKSWLDRPRPPAADQVLQLTNPSLPSGHATMATVVIGTLVVLAWSGRSTLVRVVIAVVAALWVVAVGLTRVYLGEHWFSDVLAGWLVGAAWLATCVAIWSWWRARHPAS